MRNAALALAALALAACAREGPRPNVLLITVDTLRADRLSAAGYARATTPNLDRLAAEGLRFTRAGTPRAKTTPAIASLMTGLYPHDHGAWSACAFYGGREHNTFWRRTTHGLEKASGKEYGEGDVVIMGTDVVHSIHNPLRITNAALHVFAGNPFTTPHRQWDAETLHEAPFDNAYMMQAYPTPA